MPYHWLKPFTDPRGKDVLCIPNRRKPRRRFSPSPATSQPMRDYHGQPMKSHYTLNSQLQFAPMDFFFIIPLPNSPLAFVKEQSSLWFSRLASGFCCSVLVLIAIPLILQITGCKIVGCFTLKIDPNTHPSFWKLVPLLMKEEILAK